MSQATLAGKLGMSSTALGRRMTGEVPFDVDELERAGALLEFSITIPTARAS
jgi:transcriptional regulator with XRE-family HTH domain